jgi:hypothetical protein
MERKEILPEDIRNKLDLILSESGKQYQKGDIKSSLNTAMNAWDLIPEPKNSWDYYPQSLSRGFVEDFVILRDIENVKKWIEITAQMYDDPNHEDHLILMLEGEAMLDLGDLDRAYYIFDRIHEIYGPEGFKGDQKKYFDFYQNKKSGLNE